MRAVLDLVTAGEAFDDVVLYGLARLPREGEEIRTDRIALAPGGGAVITAIAGSRLGLGCGILAGLSAGAARVLRREGVRVTNLRRASEPPALTVALSTSRDRAFVTFNGMNRLLPARIRARVASLRARHVHFAFRPRPCGPWIAIVGALRRRGTTSSWDFGWHTDLRRDRDFWPLAASVDYLFVNRDEAIAYAGVRTLAAAIDRWRRAPCIVVIKLGARGARIVGGGHDVRAKGLRVHAIETTGAGDAFNAGFLAARLRGLDLHEALHRANRLGARAVRHAGGVA